MNSKSEGIFSTPKKKAWVYVRHSDDRQVNSDKNQLEEIHEFVKKNDINIFREFFDARAHTGLNDKRPAFQEMLSLLQTPEASQVDYVIVYDITRFGRFIDPDESASLEYTCKKHGKELISMIRGIPDKDQQLMHHVMRAIDRVSAADFSKTLSRKVKGGAVTVVKQGFSAGGRGCYGLERILLDEKMQPLQVLKDGERKVVSNQRVKFAPSVGQAAIVVRRIFDEFVKNGKTLEEITRGLNEDGICSPKGYRWKAPMIRRILRCLAYTGHLTYNKTSGLLRTPRRKNHRSKWIITPNAFPSLIAEEVFMRAQELLDAEYHPEAAERRRYIAQFYRFLWKKLDVHLSEDRAKHIPLRAAVAFERHRGQVWCFRLHRPHISAQKILCVGLSRVDHASSVYIPGMETFFVFPASLFCVSGYTIVSEEDREYRVSKEEAESFILRAAREDDR